MARSRDENSSISPHQQLFDLLTEAGVERSDAAVLLCIHTMQVGFSSHIQKNTGLSQTDVSKATCRLSERGLIEHELVRGSGPGRPRKRYSATGVLAESVNQLMHKEREMIAACEQNLISMERWKEQVMRNTGFKAE